ncbi:DUF2306 domain-containing protein [Fulvivirgaceae bacterium BMA10]|uniref:DUF2306 domain-containing protein n=1 Tax=Splendidivirga corallicola TaxID=3051826 RepID=A0ABT8KT92_9BACT|nr:DUF2306 domain-containing protein [Fulvivirgaceae bacterium BMA10]
MEKIIQASLVLHIAAGMIALAVAPIAMVTKKGGKQHRLWGKVYFWGMTIVTITALVMSIYKFIPFLLMIAIFSYYSIVSGYRTLYHKKLHKGEGVKLIDWFALVITAIFNVAFVLWGISMVLNSSDGFFAYLAIGFGIGGLSLVISNLRSFIKPPKEKNAWLFNHIGGMIGGYIATLTAFSATVLNFLPGIWAWIWPSIIGIPLINFWIIYYKRKLSTKGSVRIPNISGERSINEIID